MSAPDTQASEGAVGEVRPFTKLRADVFEVLRRHDVSDQCFAEVAAITYAAVAAHEPAPVDPLLAAIAAAWPAAGVKPEWLPKFAAELRARLPAAAVAAVEGENGRG